MRLLATLSFLAPLIVVPVAVALLGERPSVVVAGATLIGFPGGGLMLCSAMVGPEPLGLIRAMLIVVAAAGSPSPTGSARG